jgi:hypothetical protein
MKQCDACEASNTIFMDVSMCEECIAGILTKAFKGESHHKCDRCKEWKKGPEPGASYFTDRSWFCDDCKRIQLFENAKREMVELIRGVK